MSALGRIRAKNSGVNLLGKRAVVVGGTSGIGTGVALRLAKANVSVTVVGRNRRAGEEVVSQMRSVSGSPQASFDFVECDASLLANAKGFAASYAARPEVSSLDYLVLTQGIATTQGYTPTSEGLDQKMALHCYGRMAFVDQLLPLLRRSHDGRVLSVLSGGVHSPYTQYAEDADLSQAYSLAKAANAAGFYNDIALDAFSRDNPGLTFIHAAPGFVRTNWGTEMPWLIKGAVRMLARVMGKDRDDCGELMCDSLFSPDNKGFCIVDEFSQPAKRTPLHEQAFATVWKHVQDVLRSRLS
eukprot:TRINITY_DN1305_c0_g4_i2.p1 TRINITY_DN1305_c0_g4~~TRINITY_DN1305_c0_g4_i2.p1  ORF type:complete len:299 (+),score=134.77 TRINITY_DN1305_c0_g4_i2:750-1646(+)